MFQKITVIRESLDRLVKQDWVFTYSEDRHALYLHDYGDWNRPSRRHGYVCEKHWQRIDERQNTIKLDEVPFPADVVIEARKKFCDSLDVQKEWKP
jgi:hypothetical protein